MAIKRHKIYRLYNVKIQSFVKKYSAHLFLSALAISVVSLVIATSPTHATTNGLIGEWKLDEGTGTTVADTSGNGNNGTIVRGTGTGSPAWVSPGHDANHPYALDFDGTGASSTATNSVNLGNSTILDQMNNYTISLWVKFKPGYVGGDNTWANLIGRNSSGADWAWMIYVNGSGHIRPHHRNSNGTYAPLTDSVAVMPIGQWVHIEQIADGSHLHLYINGQEDANFPITYSGTTMSLPTANTYIGQDTRGNAPLATISDVKIYNNAEIAPQATTGTATATTRTSTTLHGTLSSLGDFTAADVFFRYRVAGSSGAYTETAPQAVTTTGPFSANISGLTAGTQYEFAAVVQWQGRDGTQEVQAATANVTTDPLIVPDTVTNLQAASTGTHQIDLSWDAPTNDGGSSIIGYKIERSLNGSTWQTVTNDTASTETTYTDTGLTSNTLYYYRVSAINSVGTGSPSGTASATTGTVAPQATTGSATTITQTSANLNGSLDTLGDFTPVNVFFRYHAEDSSSYTETTPQQLTAVGPFSAAVSGLDPGTIYEFKAVAQWADGSTRELAGNPATFTTVDDHDGIPSSVEDAAPNSGDGNNDGTPDNQQANVASFVDNQTGKYVTLSLSGSCAISAVSTVAESANSQLDGGYSYPAGMVNYTADCGTSGYTAHAQIYFYGQSTGLVLRKYNPSTKSYTTVNGANLSQVTVGGQPAVLADYTIVDGGSLDTDGSANGIIVDPVGLASALGGDSGSLANTGVNIPLTVGLAASLAAGAIITTSRGRVFRGKVIRRRSVR